MKNNTVVIEAVCYQETKKKDKKVCAYCRVSTDMLQQAASYEAQKEYYKNLIVQKSGWRFVDIYADYAKSGTKEEGRSDFERMLEDCELGKIDLIYTKSISRFARNTVDCISVIRRLKELNIDVYFEKERIHTLSEKSELLLTILSSVAQAESEAVSTNQKWSVQRRFLNGTFITSNPAYGYRVNDEGMLVIMPEEAKTVRFIFNEYLTGKGIGQIAKELNERGIQTKTGKEKWIPVSVKCILNNIIYTGDSLYQKTFSEEIVPFSRKKNDGECPQIFIENDHESIISKDEYEAVQKLLQSRAIKKKYSNEKTEFRGKILCAKCGSVFYRQVAAERNGNLRITWSCKSRIESKELCDIEIIKEDLIKEKFVFMWNKLSSNRATILEPLLASLKRIGAGRTAQQEAKEFDTLILEQTKQRDILEQLMGKGYIDSAFYINEKNTIDMSISKLKKEKETALLKKEARNEIKETKKLLLLMRHTPEILEEYNKLIFEQSVEAVIVTPQREFVFILKNNLELTEQF